MATRQQPPNTPTNTSAPPFPPTANGISARRSTKSLAVRQKLDQMALRLAPLVCLTTGETHPAFPTTLLKFWLLTDDQLEGLAEFYHQRTPCFWTAQYPCPITWGNDLTLEEKRRKIGKFIGLRGCDTPLSPVFVSVSSESPQSENDSSQLFSEEEEWIRERVRKARQAEDESSEALRRKVMWNM